MNVKDLKATIKDVLKAVDGKSSIPVLRCVRMTRSEGHVAFRATDIDLWVTRVLADPDVTDFDVLVDGKAIKAALDGMPAKGEVDLSVEGDRLTLVSGPSRADVSVPFPVDDFPISPSGLDGGSAFVLEPGATAFVEIVDRIGYAAHKTAGRFEIPGIALHDGMAEATDGHRMAVVPAPWFPASMGRWILPIGFCEAVRRFKTAPKLLFFPVDEAKGRSAYVLATFEDGGEVLGRVLDSKFPDTSRVLAKVDPRVVVDFDAPDFVRMVKGISAFRVRLSFEREGMMSFDWSGPGGSQGSTAMECRSIHVSPEVEVFLNPRYLHEAVSAMRGKVTLSAWGENDFVRFDDGTSTAIVMPMSRR